MSVNGNADTLPYMCVCLCVFVSVCTCVSHTQCGRAYAHYSTFICNTHHHKASNSNMISYLNSNNHQRHASSRMKMGNKQSLSLNSCSIMHQS